MDARQDRVESKGRPKVASEPRAIRWGVPLAYFLLAFFMTYPYVVHPMTAFFAGYDSAIFLWNFWWTKLAICELGRSPFYCDYIYWPNGTSLALHPLVLPYCLLSIPFQLALGDLAGCALAMKIVTLLSLTLSGWLMYLLARRLVGHGPSAFCAGIVLAFFVCRVHRIHILHEFCVEMIVLWVMAFLWLAEQPCLRRATVLGASWALLIYASPEHALYMAIFAAIFLVCAARTSGHLMGELALSGGLALILAIPVVSHVPWQQGTVVVLDFNEISAQRSPALVAFFLPNVFHCLWGEALLPLYTAIQGPSAGSGVPEVSLGYGMLFLALTGAIRSPRGAVTFWWVGGVVFFVLILGPRLRLTGHIGTEIPLPYALLTRLIPPFRMMREPLRMMPVMMLCLAVLAAYGLKHLAGGAVGWRRWLPVGFCALIILEYLTVPVWGAAFPVPHAYQNLAKDSDDCALLEIGQVQKMGLYYQIIHRKRMFTLDPKAVVPRFSRGALDFWEKSPSFQWLFYPDDLLKLPRELRTAIIDENKRLFRQVRLKYVLLHTRVHVLGGNYWDGVKLEVTPLGHDRSANYDSVLRLHNPSEVSEVEGIVVYRFW